MTRRLLLSAALALALVAPARAYFEETSAGARVIALGPAGAAMVNDASAYRWNPAALVTLKNGELLLDYSRPDGVSDLAENTIAVATHLKSFGLAAAWHHIGVANVYGEDLFCLSAARTLTSGASGQVDAGATLKYGHIGFQPFTVVGEGTEDFGSQGHASLDVGTRWRTPWQLDLCWVVHDVTQPRYEFVPGSGGDHEIAQHELGAALHWNRESTLGASWTQQPHAPATLNVAMEITFFDVFAIRSGLRNIAVIYQAQNSPNDFTYSGGLGVYHKGYFVDIAAETSHDLGASYRASVRFPFGRGGSR